MAFPSTREIGSEKRPDARDGLLQALVCLRPVRTRWTVDVSHLHDQQVVSATTDRERIAIAQLNEILHHSMQFYTPDTYAERCMAHAIHTIIHADEDTSDSELKASTSDGVSTYTAVYKADQIIAKAREIYPDLRERLDVIKHEYETMPTDDVSGRSSSAVVEEDSDDYDDMPALMTESDSEDEE